MSASATVRPLTAVWPAWRSSLPWLILALIFVLSVAINPAFLTWQTIRIQLIQGALVGLVAIGETLAILIGRIDLSIPWTMTLSAILCADLYAAHPNVLVPLAVILVLGTTVGLLNVLGTCVLRVNALIWTLSVNLILQGVTLVYTSASASAPSVPPLAKHLATGTVAGFPLAALLWAACAIAVIAALKLLPIGRAIYAVGNNEIASLLSGVSLIRTYTAVFVTGGLAAALAGFLLSGYASQAYLGMGDDYLLTPVAAVVIGGTRLSGGRGGYGGTIAGALSVVLLQALLVSLAISQGLREIVFGAILLGLVIVFMRRES
jgi:ribose transport system permease protein